jgi:serine phosphatase RsbU (regulator of sigma subunit)
MFGYNRFYETFVELQRQNLTAQQVLNTMISRLNAFRKPGPYPDDVTLVMLKKN